MRVPVEPVRLPAVIKDLSQILNIYPLFQRGVMFMVFESMSLEVLRRTELRVRISKVTMKNWPLDSPQLKITMSILMQYVRVVRLNTAQMLMLLWFQRMIFMR